MSEYGVDSLISRISSEAKERFSSSVDEIRDRARQDLEEESRGLMDEAEKKFVDAEKRVGLVEAEELARAELEAKIRKRDYVETLVNEVVSKAKKKIDSIANSKDYEKYLTDFVKEGLVYIPKDETIIVQGNSRDRKMLKRIITRLKREEGLKMKLAKEDAPIAGGVLVKSASGSTVYDNTIETRIEKLGRELRYNLLRILAGGA